MTPLRTPGVTEPPMRILIIEDERKVAPFLKEGLQAEPSSADVATDGTEGSFLAGTEQCDAIILDAMLLKKEGFEVVNEIRTAWARFPVLKLTAKSNVGDRVNRSPSSYRVIPLPSSCSDPTPRSMSVSNSHITILVQRTEGRTERRTTLDCCQGHLFTLYSSSWSPCCCSSMCMRCMSRCANGATIIPTTTRNRMPEKSE